MIDKLIDKIIQNENCMINYADYMSFVLYDPVIGYYMKDNKKLGREGDFYTSSGVHAVFGKAFAHFFLDIIQKEKLPAVICEFGGGDGRFAKAVLDEWQRIAPIGMLDLKYSIIETSPFHRQEQKKLLSDKVFFKQFDSLETFRKSNPNIFEGIIFSNELLDAFPVHVIEKQNGNIYEVFVSVNEERKQLTEIKKLCTNDHVLLWIEKYGPKLKDGQRIEVPLYMNEWINDIYQFLSKGLLVTIDYGFTRDEWMLPQRKKGSLRGYSKHQLVDNPLLYPAEMDLTSHIHLDAFNDVAIEVGFDKIIDVRQNRFLLMIGMLKFSQENYDPNPFSEKSKQNRAIQTLINDNGISSAFHVFLHGKKLSAINSYRFLNDNPYDI
ncbi:class I SAM-dependent methyltransferase [Anaerobacillus alkalidiazotrophicus]|nr:SAM-dependent methyltransferase [Anaerobacillus alkalidiazotrophicus]